MTDAEWADAKTVLDELHAQVKAERFIANQWQAQATQCHERHEELQGRVAALEGERDRYMTMSKVYWPGRVAALTAALAIAKEMRFYCLGVDVSTQNIMDRFDAAVADL